MSDVLLLCIKKAGSDGTGSDRESLLSMRTTLFMVGLLATFSWTHKRAMWMHLISSDDRPFLARGSTIFKAVPSLQFLHTCKDESVKVSRTQIFIIQCRIFGLQKETIMTFFHLHNLEGLRHSLRDGNNGFSVHLLSLKVKHRS